MVHLKCSGLDDFFTLLSSVGNSPIGPLLPGLDNDLDLIGQCLGRQGRRK